MFTPLQQDSNGQSTLFYITQDGQYPINDNYSIVFNLFIIISIQINAIFVIYMHSFHYTVARHNVQQQKINN